MNEPVGTTHPADSRVARLRADQRQPCFCVVMTPVLGAVCLLCLLLTGCIWERNKPDPYAYPTLTRAWADPAETSITLQWAYGYTDITPAPTSTTPAPQRVEPDRVEIYFGESPTGVVLYKTLSKTDSLLTFPNLTPGKPYYFRVRLVADSRSYAHTAVLTAQSGTFGPVRPLRLPPTINTFSPGQLDYIVPFSDTTRLLVSYRRVGTYIYELATNQWVKLSEQSGYPAWNPVEPVVAIGRSYYDFLTTPAEIDVVNYGIVQSSPAKVKTIRLSASELAGYVWSLDGQSILFNLPLPTPSPLRRYRLSNDSLSVLGEPTRDNKYSFAWLGPNRLFVGGGFSSSNTISQSYDAFYPVVYDLAKGSYERLVEHPQLAGIGFPTAVNQGAQLAYTSNQSGYAAVWLYDFGTKAARQLTRRLSDRPIMVNGLRWHEAGRFLSFYYSDYSASGVRTHARCLVL